MSRLSFGFIVLAAFLLGGSVSAETVWTWNNAGTAQWNGSGNWLKDGAASTETPIRGSSNQTIHIAQGTADNSAIDMDFSATTINVTGSGTLQQTTTHYSRMYSGAMNVTGGGTVIMRANNWLLGSGKTGDVANTYSLTVDGGTFNYTGGAAGIYLGDNGAATTVTIQETLGTSTFTLNGPTYLGKGANSSGTINMSAGTASFTEQFYLGNNSGTGTFHLTGGTVTAGVVSIGNSSSSLNIGTGASMTSGAISNAGTLDIGGTLTSGVLTNSGTVTQSGALTTSGIVNSGTYTQTGALTLLNGATIDSSTGAYTVGGTVTLAAGYTVEAGAVRELGIFWNKDTAQAFWDKLDTSAVPGLKFQKLEITSATGGSGASVLYAANEGTEIPQYMVLIADTTGALSGDANWINYGADKTGYIMAGTNELVDMRAAVVVKGGSNTFSDGFIVGEVADAPQTLTFNGGTNKINGQLILGNGTGKSGSMVVNSAVTMANAVAPTDKRVAFIGYNGGTGTLTVNAGGSLITNSSQDFVVAYEDNATGTFIVDGGKFQHSSSGNFIVGGSKNGTGTMEIKAGEVNLTWMSIGQLADNSTGILKMSGGKLSASSGFRVGINNGSSGTAELSGGTITSGPLQVGYFMSNTTLLSPTGTMTLSGSANHTVNGTITVGGGAEGTLTLLGGTLSASGATTINEKGTLTLAGGTFKTTAITNAGLIDFRTGAVALSENTTLTNNGTISVTGYSTLNLSAGTVAAGTGSYTINYGENAPKKGDVYFAAVVKDSASAANFLGMTMPTGWSYTSGVKDAKTYILAAYETDLPAGGKIWVPNTSGTTDNAANWLNYSATEEGLVVGGTNTFQNVRGKILVSGGTNKVIANISGGSELTLTGGTNSTDSQIAIGDSTGSGVLTISGGTFTAPNSDFILGGNGAAATMTVTGTGIYDQHQKGNFVINATEANGGAGSIVNLEAGGTIDTYYFSMGQNVFGTHPVCTFNMTGGTLKINSESVASDGDFRISAHGNAAKSIANLSGGTVFVGRSTILDASGQGSQLNIIGPNVDFTGKHASLNATGFLNYSIGALTSEDAAAGNLLSELHFTGNATVNSTVSIDMTVSGLVNITGRETHTIFSADGTLNWNPTAITITDGWEVARNGKLVQVSMIEDAIPTAQISTGVATLVGNNNDFGLTRITGAPGATFGLAMAIEGGTRENVADLALWMGEQTGKTVTNEGFNLFLEGYEIGAEGFTDLNFGLAQFNDLNGTALRIGTYTDPNGVPEPAAWLLFALGAASVALLRKRRSGKFFTV